MTSRLLHMLLLFCSILPLQLWTQNRSITTKDNIQIAQKIVDALKEEGFQSITVRSFEDSYIVAYENRVYRFDITALRQVIEIVGDIAIAQEATKLILITKRTNLPMLSTQLSLFDYKSYKQGLLSSEALVKNLIISQNVDVAKQGVLLAKNENSGNYKVELVIRPYLSLELGNHVLADQFIHLIDMRPKLNFYLWKGAHFTYEFILPISSEFKETAPHWSEFRPRVISFTQQVRLPKNIFLNTSLGLFSRNRYGGSLALGKYFLNGQLLAAGKVGYTGHASYVRFDAVFNQVNKGWGYTDLDYLDYKGSIHYSFPTRNFQIGIEYGKVLNNKNILRFSSRHSFKELDLNFFVYKTNDGRNYGIDISVPIFPKKYRKPKLFSVRPAKKFQYAYLSHTYLAREYQAQGMYGNFPFFLDPAYIRFQILKGLN